MELCDSYGYNEKSILFQFKFVIEMKMLDYKSTITTLIKIISLEPC